MASTTAQAIGEFHTTERPQNQDEFFNNLLDLQRKGKFTDFKILVNDKEIACHRIILSSSSAYFSSLLDKKSSQVEIRMDDVDFDLLLSVVYYLYGDGITVPWENIKAALEVCHMLHLEGLKCDLEEYTIGQITAGNAIGWFKFAKEFELQCIATVAKEQMFGNIEEVCVSDDFKDFTIEEIVNFVKSEDIVIDNYDQVLMGCIEWVDYNPVARKDDMFQVMRHLDLTKCSAFMIQTAMKKYEDLFLDPRVLKLVCNNTLERLVQVEGIPNERVIICGGSVENKTINQTCWTLNINDNADKQFETLLEIPNDYMEKNSPVVCIPGGFVVCNKSTNYMYQTKTKKWTKLPDTPEAATSFSVLYNKGQIYRLGGVDSSYKAISSVYSLDLKKQNWSKCADMLTRQYHPIVTCHNDHIYVVYNTKNKTENPVKFQRHKLGSDNWTVMSDPPESAPQAYYASLLSVDASLVSVVDDLYLVGGWKKICARYNVAKDEWTVLAQCLKQHSGGAAINYNGKILLCGGYNAYQTIEEYNIAENKWSTLDLQLPKGLLHHSIGKLT